MPAPAALVQSSGRDICFCSPHVFPSGSVAELDLEVPGHITATQVRVTACRPLAGGLYLHRAEVPSPFPTYQRAHPLLRGPERHYRRVRVMSPDLPGFRALTVDVSPKGLQVVTEGPLPLGRILSLKVEFEDETIACQARVAWCAQRGRTAFHCGLELVGEIPLWSRPLAGRINRVEVSESVTIQVGRTRLTFPQAQLVRASEGGEVARLREVCGSEALAELPDFHHYQLLNEAGEVLAEVVSAAL